MTGAAQPEAAALRVRASTRSALRRAPRPRPRRLRAACSSCSARIRCARTSTSSRARSASPYGFSETLVKMIPLLLTAPRGGDPGAHLAHQRRGRGPALHRRARAPRGRRSRCRHAARPAAPAADGAARLRSAAALWAAIAGVLRARGWASETISTLLTELRRDPPRELRRLRPVEGPRGRQLSADGRVRRRRPSCRRSGPRASTWGSSSPSSPSAAFAFVMRADALGARAPRDRRQRGGRASRRHPDRRYVIVLMIVGGGLAGLAGMAEVSAIQGRLRPSLSPGYGYSGFLISWMAGGHPAGIVVAALRARGHHRRRRHLADDPGAARLRGEHPDGGHAVRRARTRRERVADRALCSAACSRAPSSSGTPLLYATLAELLSQRAGVVNLGLEGVMLVGAVDGLRDDGADGERRGWAWSRRDSPAGSSTSLFAYLVVTRRANQLATGLALMFAASG